MIEAFIDRVLSGTFDKLLGRLAVGLLVVVACGFATGAVLVKLIDLYGAPLACTMLAAAFAVAAGIGALVIRKDAPQSADSDTAEAAEQTSEELKSMQASLVEYITKEPTMALAIASSALGAIRTLGSRGTLVVLGLAALVATYFWRTSGAPVPATPARDPVPRPTPQAAA